MMPHWIKSILSSRAMEVVARIVLTFPFWGSGLSKLIDFPGATAEMSKFGLDPAWAFAVLTILVCLGGSALIITNRHTWLGAGALATFTFLTIPIVHHFWKLEGERGLQAFYTAAEHMGMIGGLMVVAVLSVRPRPDRSWR